MGLDYYLYPFDVRTYESKVVPAYQSLADSGSADSLIAIVHECDEILDSEPHLRQELYWTKDAVAEDIGVLSGTFYYSSKGESSSEGKTTSREDKEFYARSFVAPKVLEVLCIPRFADATPQNMGRSPLVPYLYERSEFINDVFTSVRPLRGKELSLAIGEYMELFSAEDLLEFKMALEGVGTPVDPFIRKEYENIVHLIELTMEGSDLTLARCLI